MSLSLCLHCSFLILAWRLFCDINDKSVVEFTEQHLECIHQLKDGEIHRQPYSMNTNSVSGIFGDKF